MTAALSKLVLRSVQTKLPGDIYKSQTRKEFTRDLAKPLHLTQPQFGCKNPCSGTCKRRKHLPSHSSRVGQAMGVS